MKKIPLNENPKIAREGEAGGVGGRKGKRCYFIEN